jgi:hypothetical protein
MVVLAGKYPGLSLFFVIGFTNCLPTDKVSDLKPVKQSATIGSFLMESFA